MIAAIVSRWTPAQGRGDDDGRMAAAGAIDKASILDGSMKSIHAWRMDRTNLPLNALRAFEASARHLNFTRAALEL